MVTMHILRMLADTAFYCSFAGFFAARWGAGGAFAGSLLQCLLFGLSSLGGEKRWLRLALLLPMGLCFLFHSSSPADCILLIPSSLYIIWMVYRGDYALSWDRQQRLFSLYVKAMGFFACIAMLTGGRGAVTAISLPYAMVMLAASVLLLRSLRHEQRVYTQKKYQLFNLGAVGLAVAAAFLISSEPALKAMAALLKGGYEYVALPVLLLLLNIVLAVLWLVAQAFVLTLGKLFHTEQQIEMNIWSATELLEEAGIQSQPNELLRQLGALALALGVAVLLVFFFRWLGRRERHLPQDPHSGSRYTPLPAQQEAPRSRESSPIRSIRAQYRKFLKLCAQQGVLQERGSTSLDIELKARHLPGFAGLSDRIRDIYILARYAGQGGKQSAEEMKRLYAEVKKETARKG